MKMYTWCTLNMNALDVLLLIKQQIFLSNHNSIGAVKI